MSTGGSAGGDGSSNNNNNNNNNNLTALTNAPNPASNAPKNSSDSADLLQFSSPTLFETPSPASAPAGERKQGSSTPYILDTQSQSQMQSQHGYQKVPRLVLPAGAMSGTETATVSPPVAFSSSPIVSERAFGSSSSNNNNNNNNTSNNAPNTSLTPRDHASRNIEEMLEVATLRRLRERQASGSAPGMVSSSSSSNSGKKIRSRGMSGTFDMASHSELLQALLDQREADLQEAMDVGQALLARTSELKRDLLAKDRTCDTLRSSLLDSEQTVQKLQSRISHFEMSAMMSTGRQDSAAFGTGVGTKAEGGTGFSASPRAGAGVVALGHHSGGLPGAGAGGSSLSGTSMAATGAVGAAGAAFLDHDSVSGNPHHVGSGSSEDTSSAILLRTKRIAELALQEEITKREEKEQELAAAQQLVVKWKALCEQKDSQLQTNEIEYDLLRSRYDGLQQELNQVRRKQAAEDTVAELSAQVEVLEQQLRQTRSELETERMNSDLVMRDYDSLKDEHDLLLRHSSDKGRPGAGNSIGLANGREAAAPFSAHTPSFVSFDLHGRTLSTAVPGMFLSTTPGTAGGLASPMTNAGFTSPMVASSATASAIDGTSSPNGAPAPVRGPGALAGGTKATKKNPLFQSQYSVIPELGDTNGVAALPAPAAGVVVVVVGGGGGGDGGDAAASPSAEIPPSQLEPERQPSRQPLHIDVAGSDSSNAPVAHYPPHTVTFAEEEATSPSVVALATSPVEPGSSVVKRRSKKSSAAGGHGHSSSHHSSIGSNQSLTTHLLASTSVDNSNSNSNSNSSSSTGAGGSALEEEWTRVREKERQVDRLKRQLEEELMLTRRLREEMAADSGGASAVGSRGLHTHSRSVSVSSSSHWGGNRQDGETTPLTSSSPAHASGGQPQKNKSERGCCGVM